ncbi:2OG-Fe(II) oxygenase [Burkholderia stagnalis]
MSSNAWHDMPSPPADRMPAAGTSADVQAGPAIADRIGRLDTASLATQFANQDAFLYLEDFMPSEVTARIAKSARELLYDVNRSYLPGHKQGGSVSRHVIDAKAPFIAELYRSQELIGWLERITGERLQVSPADDAHAYALYYYMRAGDHIGWHYDTSYYDGRRYTVLLGVIDESSCALEYELYTRNEHKADEPHAVHYPPGALIAFDGDKLRHRVTPARENELRVSLTFEYVTHPTMRPAKRFISNMKDAVAYFGVRQVFRRLAVRRGRTA